MKEDAFDEDKITHTVKLCDIETNKVFYKKLDFIYVEIAKFKKTEDELETLYDKWLYMLKNLYKLENRPKALRDKVFDRLFQEAEIAKFTPEELREYEDSLKAYRDIKNSIETAKREGIAEGRAEGEAMEKKATIKRLLASGASVDIIAIATELTHDNVQLLIDEISKE